MYCKLTEVSLMHIFSRIRWALGRLPQLLAANKVVLANNAVASRQSARWNEAEIPRQPWLVQDSWYPKLVRYRLTDSCLAPIPPSLVLHLRWTDKPRKLNSRPLLSCFTTSILNIPSRAPPHPPANRKGSSMFLTLKSIPVCLLVAFLIQRLPPKPANSLLYPSSILK